jgi:hypothetical protein
MTAARLLKTDALKMRAPIVSEQCARAQIFGNPHI